MKVPHCPSLDSIPFNELHDLLCIRGNEIGYYEALIEFAQKEYLDDDILSRLSSTLFADNLKSELTERNYFKTIKEVELADYFKQLMED